jgi:hypothetical protein
MGQGRELMRASQRGEDGSVPDGAIEKNRVFFRILEKIEGKPVEVFPQRKNKKKLFYLNTKRIQRVKGKKHDFGRLENISSRDRYLPPTHPVDETKGA